MTETLDIHTHITQLTQPHTHREPYTITTGRTTITDNHITKAPALIDQLNQAEHAHDGNLGSGGYSSRPTANLDAVDTLIHIDLEAARWVRDLGENDPGDTKACLLKLHGLHPSTHRCGPHPKGRDCCTYHQIERDVRRWWLHARIVTGWDSPAWRPDNTCPACEKRGGLRVRLAAAAALCIDCRADWDEDTIGLLAEHIRVENEPDADTPITA